MFLFRIQVEPEVSQFDQKVCIKVTGLTPNSKVTGQLCIRSRWIKKDIALVSHGHYYTDAFGVLDLERDPSLRGSYTGRLN